MEDASDLQVVRSRLVTSSFGERRRIERALHDGLQQDLIAISIRLQLLRDLLGTAPPEALAALDDVRQDVRDTLDRLRALSAEIYPAILAARGLPDALRQVAGTSRPGAQVDVAGLGRYPDLVEAAVLFLWRAVLDSPGASARSLIRVREDGHALKVDITVGGAVDHAAVRDLVEGAGGTLTVEAAGAHIGAVFPLAP